MFSLLKKAVIAVAFVITFTVAASPVDYLSADSDAYLYVNISNLLNAKTVQQFIPMVDKELKEAGLKARDFDGKVALGINISAKNNNIQANLDAILELKNAKAKDIFDTIIISSDEDFKAETIAGKPAIKSDDVRIILQTPNVLILQGHLEGKKPFATLSNKGWNPIKQIRDLNQYDVAFYMNVAQAASKFKNELPEEARESILKIKDASIFAKMNVNGSYSFKLVANCKSVDDAKALAAELNAFIKLLSVEEGLKPIFKKINVRTYAARITVEVTLTDNDINTLMQLAE